MMRNLIRYNFLMFVLFLSSATTSFALGQIEPATLSYQGILTDSAGVAMTGIKQLQICLYDNPVTAPGLPANGGTAFWCDSYSVLLKGGQFSVVLGRDDNPLKGADPLTAFSKFAGTTYVGVKVDTNPEMTPRQKLTSVAYAFNSAIAYNAISAENAKFADKVIPTNTASIIPPGTIVAFGGANPPAGWLLCDGSSLLKTDYPDLFSAILTAHGSADSLHFNLPDYRGRFLRGVDYSPNVVPNISGRDPDSAGRTAMNPGGFTGNKMGTLEEDAFQKHWHKVQTPEPNQSLGGSTTIRPTLGAGMDYGVWNYPYTELPNDPVELYASTIMNPTGINARVSNNDTRPKNAYVNWIIKY